MDEVTAALSLAPGDVIADLGAGTGPFVAAFGRAVSRQGKVYAVELDSGFFPHIQAKAKAAGLTNVQTVSGQPDDPRLPARDVDVAFFHDVLHHVQNRDVYLKNLVGYLEPGGRIAVIDYQPAQSPHRDEPSLQVAKEQVTGWLAPLGYVPVQEHDTFSDKYFVVYARKGARQ